MSQNNTHLSTIIREEMDKRNFLKSNPQAESIHDEIVNLAQNDILKKVTEGLTVDPNVVRQIVERHVSDFDITYRNFALTAINKEDASLLMENLSQDVLNTIEREVVQKFSLSDNGCLVPAENSFSFHQQGLRSSATATHYAGQANRTPRSSAYEPRRGSDVLASPAHKLKWMRRNLDMNQQEFVNTLGIATITLKSWEQGVRTPSGAANILIDLIYDDLTIVDRIQRIRMQKQDAVKVGDKDRHVEHLADVAPGKADVSYEERELEALQQKMAEYEAIEELKNQAADNDSAENKSEQKPLQNAVISPAVSLPAHNTFIVTR